MAERKAAPRPVVVAGGHVLVKTQAVLAVIPPPGTLCSDYLTLGLCCPCSVMVPGTYGVCNAARAQGRHAKDIACCATRLIWPPVLKPEDEPAH